jgi:hypothetical protein
MTVASKYNFFFFKRRGPYSMWEKNASATKLGKYHIPTPFHIRQECKGLVEISSTISYSYEL